MASVVSICNLALSHLGDSATVSSINPPEGSAQAEYCATFYPMARDALLEMHAWSFAVKRLDLAQLDCDGGEWDYVYALPNDCLRVLEIQNGRQEFVREIRDDGQLLLLCDTYDATIRYIARIEDTTRYSPLFVLALSWKLASMLAGVVIKGDTGAQFAAVCEAQVRQYLVQAQNSDGLQHHPKQHHMPCWIKGR